jgi:uroporphyrinogen III methyltransferase/synthase
VQRAGLASPVLVVVGSVVELRQQLQWFERRPLFGRRILVTRPRQQAAELAQRLELLGAVPFVLPVVEIRELSDWSAVDRTIEQLHTFHWLVFTSANGVHAFLGRLKALDKDWRVLGPLKIAAIGPKTAEVLASYHLRADVIPPVFRSEELAETLKPLVQGQKVLLARADRGRDVLPRELATVAQVQQLAVYSQVDAATVDAALLDRLRRGEIEYVTLTSPSIAAALLQSLDEVCRARLSSGEIKLVSISPVTSSKVRELGFAVAAEAREYTTAGLLEAMIQLSQSERVGVSAGP